MAGNGRNNVARGYGVAVLLQILDHGHLRELKVGQDHAPRHFEARYTVVPTLDAANTPSGLMRQCPDSSFAAALAQHRGRIDTDRMNSPRAHTAALGLLAARPRFRVAGRRPHRPRTSMRAGNNRTGASYGRPPSDAGHVAIPIAKCSVSMPFSSRLLSALRWMRNERASYLLPRLGFGPLACNSVTAFRITTYRDQRVHRHCVARQKAVDSLGLGAQVESAYLQVAVEEEGIRSRVVD